MNTTLPAGLARFQRSMISKRADHCFYCGIATVPGIDFAALNGKWLSVCALHASSTVEQCKALLLLIQAEAVTYGLDADAMAQVNAHAPANLGDVLTGNCEEYDNVAAALKLHDALTIVRTYKPESANIRSNQYAGRCGTCGGDVGKGEGRIEKINNKWATFHLDGQCVTTTATVTPVAEVAEGRYALTGDDGTVRFYRVEHGAKGGKWDGFVFVSAVASDDLHPIRNRVHRQSIIDAIAADPLAALALYGRELGKCGRCGRPLTSEWRKQGIGPVCVNKAW